MLFELWYGDCAVDFSEMLEENSPITSSFRKFWKRETTVMPKDYKVGASITDGVPITNSRGTFQKYLETMTLFDCGW